MKWDIRFLRIAAECASWSKDPSTKVGVVAVNPAKRNVLATGYNGFPRNIRDRDEHLNDRVEKYKRMIHAELNAVCNAAWNGVSLRNSTFYVWNLPVCSSCALIMIQVGVDRVVECYSDEIDERWVLESEVSRGLFNEAGINLVSYSREYMFDGGYGGKFREDGQVLSTGETVSYGGGGWYEPIERGEGSSEIGPGSSYEMDEYDWRY